MLIEWLNWVRSLRLEEVMLVLGVLLLVDAPRYAFSVVLMAAWDLVRTGFGRSLPGPIADSFDYQPSAAALIVGYNEGSTIYRTLESVWGTYPDLKVIVIDDGSTDDMYEEAARFATEHDNVQVLRRDERGGKSSALNMALHMTDAEVIVTIDADSRLDKNAILELIQPLASDSVGAVSATVVAWNPFASICAWLQAYEYRQTIFINRMFKGRVGVLGIVSGAFGAFRRSAVERIGGWDVGPGEDGDLILRLRKLGYRIAVAPYATCFTNVPTTWAALSKQRCRWDRTVITFECRKHSDMANPFSEIFSWQSLCMLGERWFFNVICVYTFWLYGVWVFFVYPESAFKLTLLLYCCGFCVELIQALGLLFYSNRFTRDLALCAILPLYPLYQVILKAVDVFAITREIFLRDSTTDNFVPERVRKATFQW